MSFAAQAVTFDCWNTLIHELAPEAARAMRVEALADAVSLPFDDAAELFQTAWQEHFNAWHRHEQFGAIGMVGWIAERYPIDDAAQADLQQSLEEITLAVGVTPVDGACETLAALRDAGIKTALICDTGLSPGRVVRTLLDGHGIAPLLDGFAFSDEVGVPKPDERMFRAALEELGTRAPGSAVHVGDLRRTDIAGARSAGLHAVRFRGVYDDDSDYPDGDAVIDDLRAIPALVGLPDLLAREA